VFGITYEALRALHSGRCNGYGCVLVFDAVEIAVKCVLNCDCIVVLAT